MDQSLFPSRLRLLLHHLVFSFGSIRFPSEASKSYISANQMALSVEVTVYKGSKSGKVIREVVKGKQPSSLMR